MKIRLSAISIVCLWLQAVSTSAHHSFVTHYDYDREIVVTGKSRALVVMSVLSITGQSNAEVHICARLLADVSPLRQKIRQEVGILTG